MTDLKKAALVFIKEYHAKHGEAPSIKILTSEVEGLSRRQFYKAFKGLSEACKLAGVPAPKARIAATRKALKEKEKGSRSVDRHRVGDASDRHLSVDYDHSDLSSRITLTEAQTKRLLGISHLEGGKDPSVIIDEVLDRDTFLRDNKELSLEDTADTFHYIKAAKERRWQTGWLLDTQTRLWNAGVMRMSEIEIQDLTNFLEKMKGRGWKIEEIPDFLSKPAIRYSIPQLSPEQGEHLNTFLSEMKLKGLTVGEYMKQIAEFRHAMSWHSAYREGRVTWEQFKKEVKLQ